MPLRRRPGGGTVTAADETYPPSASFYGKNGPWFQLPASSLRSRGEAFDVTSHKLSANRERVTRARRALVVLSGAPEPYAAEHGTHVEEVRVR